MKNPFLYLASLLPTCEHINRAEFTDIRQFLLSRCLELPAEPLTIFGSDVHWYFNPELNRCRRFSPGFNPPCIGFISKHACEEMCQFKNQMGQPQVFINDAKRDVVKFESMDPAQRFT